MRLVALVALLGALMVGLGYPYSRESSVPTFLTPHRTRGRPASLASYWELNCRNAGSNI